MRVAASIASISALILALVAPSPARAQAPGQWSPPAGRSGAPLGAQPPTTPYGQPMEAGGLTPPPPLDPKPAPGTGASTAPAPGVTPPPSVDGSLERSREQDSGRGLTWVWLDFEGGFQHVGLQTFNVDESSFTAGFIETSASGGMIGGGVGARLLFVTLGARARLGFFSAWQLFSVGGELAFRIPIGNLEPHIDVGVGYTGLGSFSDAVAGAADAIDIRGLDARIGGGLDYFVTPVVSLGGSVSWEFLALTRPGLDPDAIAQLQGDPDVNDAETDALAAEGSGYGSALSITGRVGLHF